MLRVGGASVLEIVHTVIRFMLQLYGISLIASCWHLLRRDHLQNSQVTKFPITKFPSYEIPNWRNIGKLQNSQVSKLPSYKILKYEITNSQVKKFHGAQRHFLPILAPQDSVLKNPEIIATESSKMRSL